MIGTGHYQERWDEHAAVPYLIRNGGGSVISFDNPESVRRKCEYANQLGCGGIMIWNLGSDLCGKQSPLTDTVVQALGGQPATLTDEALKHEVATAQAEVAQLKASLPANQMHTGEMPTESKVSASSLDQLESRYAELQHLWGVIDDQVWKTLAPGKDAH